MCKACGETKPFDAFYRAQGTRDGRRNDGKACNLAEKAARHRANPEPGRRRVAQWRIDHPERYQQLRMNWVKSGGKKLADRRSHLKRKFGLTLEQYDEMLAAQGGVCAICGREPRDDISLHVDHDHVTGQIRKLLCFKCNNALGDFDDDPQMLQKAIAYLDDHNPEVQEMAELIRRRLAELCA